jgi:hypothetical protein
MNDEHFNEIAKKHYTKFSAERIAFLRKMAELIDNYEQLTNEVVGNTIMFDVSNPIYLNWNGERFVKLNVRRERNQLDK